MGRTDQYIKYKESNNTLDHIIKDPNIKEDRILIVDADSILYSCSVPRKDEDRESFNENEISTIIIPRIKERIFSLKEEVSKGFNIIKIYCFIGGKGSYRKDLYPLYKSNRTKLDIIPIVKQYCIEDKELNFIPAKDKLEADDMLFLLGEKYGELSILSYIDKDLKQIKGTCYDYNKNIWFKITEKEARYNLAKQVGIGDDGDFVKINKGLGEAKIKKYISLGMTDYQYMKGLIQAYRDYNKDVKDVKPLIRMIYKLVSLGKIYEK